MSTGQFGLILLASWPTNRPLAAVFGLFAHNGWAPSLWKLCPLLKKIQIKKSFISPAMGTFAMIQQQKDIT